MTLYDIFNDYCIINNFFKKCKIGFIHRSMSLIPTLSDLISQHYYFHAFVFLILNSHQRFKGFIEDYYYYIKYRTTDKYHIVDTGLKPGYHDTDTRMANAIFNLFIKFIEVEYIHDVKMWNSLPNDMDAEDVFKYTLTFRPDDKELHDIYLYAKNRNFDAINGMDERYYEEDTKVLLRIIQIRGKLWT